MGPEDQELIDEFVIESNEHLSDIEGQLLSIESAGADIDVDLVNTVFRGVHSIKGAAGFLGLTRVNELAHAIENVLNLMRERTLVPTSAIINVMLSASDTLQSMLDDIFNSNDVDVSSHVTTLEAIAEGGNGDAAPSEDETAATEQPAAEMPEEVAAQAPAPVAETPVAEAPAAKAPEPQPAPEPAPAPKPKPAAKKPDNDAAGAKSSGSASETNIRVSVEALDRLMNLAGELVLGRNQLMQTIAVGETSGLEAVAAKVNQVTCEMQDAVMQTRMQPIGNVFNRFNRVVRDLSAKLGKRCRLTIEGKDVEVDKTIIEAIADPLTHLVRNAIDHGLETPDIRDANGKPAEGELSLRAFHQSGKVCIEIADDGGGIDTEKIKQKAIDKGLITEDQASDMHGRDALRLIFAPGFSTAEQISDVSGRGVGMDVVRTNIERLGGAVEIESNLGEGTTIQVKLPLTLAIIPSLIVHCRGSRFAIPQLNIVELVRIRRRELDTRIGTVKNAEVLRLRGCLLPLVRLGDALNLQSDEGDDSNGEREALSIIVVETGQQRFGLIVDGLFDSEEIVVKPLGRHLNECRCLSGATILGDGRIALILDVAGIGQHVQLDATADVSNRIDTAHDEEQEIEGDTQSLLLFNNHDDEQFAVPMGVVSRIERIQWSQTCEVGNQLLLQYPDRSLPLIRLENEINASAPTDVERVFIVVFEVSGKEFGLIAPILHDVRTVTAVVDDATLQESGVIGSLVIDETTTRLLDMHELVLTNHAGWLTKRSQAEEEETPIRILLVEDSNFFRRQVRKQLEQDGFEITEAVDGQEGWEIVQRDPSQFDLLVTDIEMPRMNGFEFCKRVKRDPATKQLPVIALTSLAGDEDMRKGIECGVDDYQVKLDREELLKAIQRLMPEKAAKRSTKPIVAPVVAPAAAPIMPGALV